MEGRVMLQRWATPEGVVALVALLGVLGSVATAVFSALGWKNAAEKSKGLTEELQGHKDQLAKVVPMAVSLVKGVEAAKDSLDAASAQKLVDSIKAVTTAAGHESVVNALVKAVTEGRGTVAQVLGQELTSEKPPVVSPGQ